MTEPTPIRPHLVELLTILAAIGDDHRDSHFFTALAQVITILNRDPFLTPAEIAAASTGDLTPLQAINRIRRTFREFDGKLEGIAMRLAPLLGQALKLPSDQGEDDEG